MASRLNAAETAPHATKVNTRNTHKENLMRTFTLVAACLAVATLAFSSAAYADDEAVFQKLLQDKANSVVSVKFVLNVKISRGGTPMGPPQERSSSSTGVVVDKSGLIMISGQSFGVGNLGIPRAMRSQFEISAVPSNIRVVFPGDTNEYNAVMGAKDSKLGLVFVMIKDLADKKIPALDMETSAEPKLGQTLYGVSRLDQGFDHAPVAMRAKVAGSVTKPRTMWIVQNAGSHVGMPLYDAAGAMTGIVVTQEGVGDDSATLPFLLPLSVVKPTVATALKKSKAELDRILEEEEEAAAEAAAEKAAAEKDAEKKDADPKADEKKADEKKDAPKDDGKKDGE